VSLQLNAGDCLFLSDLSRLHYRVDRVVAALVKASTVEAVPEQRDPESRRNAVHALAKLLDSLSEDGNAPIPTL
jgi:hypothetical protein